MKRIVSYIVQDNSTDSLQKDDLLAGYSSQELVGVLISLMIQYAENAEETDIEKVLLDELMPTIANEDGWNELMAAIKGRVNQ